MKTEVGAVSLSPRGVLKNCLTLDMRKMKIVESKKVFRIGLFA